ncbi:hypothetical protein AB0P21_40755 [Kribbella sp. NPDC056861]|uniref:hypothetical protein n=1 Tax=Kribbella sp. NPDC056861 TaxID=3154857 RepID=UPI0034149E86
MTGGFQLQSWMGVAGLAILAFVLLHLLVRRFGGWVRLYRRIKREVLLVIRSWTRPLTAAIRYRRRLRLLTQALRDPATWTVVGKAFDLAARHDTDLVPYCAVASGKQIGILLAGPIGDGVVPEPWRQDPIDQRLWWIDRRELIDPQTAGPTAPAREEAPLLVCLGLDSTGKYVVMVDLLAGPPAVSVYGAPKASQGVVQAIAAQLDVRLPVGAVEVASGVHDHYPGLLLSEAVRRPGAWIAIGAEDLEHPLPRSVRLISLGVTRGRGTLLEVRRDGSLRWHGAADWLEIDHLPLSRAVALSIGSLPEHDFQRPLRAGDDPDDLHGARPVTEGVSATSAGTAGSDRRTNSWT